LGDRSYVNIYNSYRTYYVRSPVHGYNIVEMRVPCLVVEPTTKPGNLISCSSYIFNIMKQ